MTPPGLCKRDRKLLLEAVEVLQNKIYFARFVASPHDTLGLHFFSTDDLFIYEPFFLDFGPLNLSCIYRYCSLLKAKLANPLLQGKALVHYSSYSPQHVTNAVLLLCSFLVAAAGKSPDEALEPFLKTNIYLASYRDATYSQCSFRLTVLDCLQGLAYAMQLGWFSLSSFNQAQYEHYERLENGDMSWVIPGKFLAFSCPSIGAAAMCPRRSSDCSSSSSSSSSGSSSSNGACNPSYYVRVFKKLNIKLVIRLNKKMYDSEVFKEAGIDHQDLFFVDGTCPPRDIMDKFLKLCEACDGAVAVHCKAGLGRTGSLIGCYAIKNHKFPALPWIGWNRICRPGSVLGPQQYFLCAIENELMKREAAPGCPAVRQPPRERVSEDAELETLALSMKDMQLEDRRIAQHGDEGQGERLMEAKRRSKPALGCSANGEASQEPQDERAAFRSDSAAAAAGDLSTSSRFDAIVRSKIVGPLVPSFAAGAASGRKGGSSCHGPAAAAAAAAAAGGPSSGIDAEERERKPLEAR